MAALALDEVVQPAGCSDQDVRASRSLRLSGDRDASVDGGDAEVARGESVELTGDLGRQLARGNEDKRCGVPLAGLEALHDRDREAERLARAGRGLGEHVASGECVGE